VDIEIVLTRRCLLEEFTCSVTQQFVNANLNFKCRISVCPIYRNIVLTYERDFLIWSFGTENISKTYILEPEVLSNVLPESAEL
jgi:hypothetical protein